MTDLKSAVSTADIDLRSEITVWLDPSELAEVAFRKARRADEAEAAAELLDLARGDRTIVREAMEYVVTEGRSGAATQGALRLLFNAYQLATRY